MGRGTFKLLNAKKHFYNARPHTNENAVLQSRIGGWHTVIERTRQPPRKMLPKHNGSNKEQE